MNRLFNGVKYVLLIGRRFGWKAAPKFVYLWAVAKIRSRDPEFCEKIANAQRPLFDEIGASAEEGRALAVEITESMNLPPGAVMVDRIHIQAFAALQKAGFRPRSILELGTNTGQTSHFLARLFPDATVYTVDLPPEDPMFKVLHPDGEGEFIDATKPNLTLDNIVSLRTNTLFLMEKDLPEMDLVWLDAGHHYPEVAWDHFFCLSKLASGGWLFSDDVVLPDNLFFGHDPAHLEVGQLLEYLNERLPDPFMVIPKRTELDQNIIFEKFIGVLHKK